jgi:hypothetical protein
VTDIPEEKNLSRYLSSSEIESDAPEDNARSLRFHRLDSPDIWADRRGAMLTAGRTKRKVEVCERQRAE